LAFSPPRCIPPAPAVTAGAKKPGYAGLFSFLLRLPAQPLS
jgi:hypothetical protein